MIAVHPAYKTVQEAIDKINTHGLGLIKDAISIDSISRLNGDMSISLEVPLSEYNLNLLTADKLICLNGQYYRIQRPERSDIRGKGVIRIEALHVLFDLQKSVIENIETKEDPRFIDGITAEQALKQVLEGSEFSAGTVDLSLDKLEYLDILRQNRMEVLKQIIDKWGGEIVADNWTISLHKEAGEDRGVRLSLGDTIDGISVSEDISKVVTRLYPYGYQETNIESVNNGVDYLDSPFIDSYARILEGYANFDDIDDPAELKRLGLEKLDELDKPEISVKIDMVKLKNDPQWRHYGELNRIELGDRVNVKHMALKSDIKLRVLEIEKDEISGDITRLKLGNAKGDGLFRGFASTTTIAISAQEQAKKALNKIDGINIKADAIEAIKARIRELVAGNITTDQLYADLAAIAVAQITTANIDRANISWASINTLTSSIADIVNAEIANANIEVAKIDYAKIVDSVTDTAIITEGEAGKLYIARLAVTDANMVQLTAGKIMLKAADGSFVQLVANTDGTVGTQPVEVEGDNIANSTISGGKLIENSITARELNVQQIFADEALIRAIKAKNLDVADLFAAEATISELNNYILRTNTIEAIKGKLNVWAEDKIALEVGKVQIGGTNILRNSGRFNDLLYWSVWSGDNSATLNRRDPDRWGDLPLYVSLGSEAANLYNHSISNYPFAVGEQYTLSFWARYSFTYTISIRDSDSTNAVANFGSMSPKETYADGWNYYEATAEVTSAPNAPVLYIDLGASQWRWMTRFKLEEGTMATDWSPAPSDPASAVKTSHITIENDKIDIATGGKLNMRGGTVNLEAGSDMAIKSGANFNLTAGSGANGVGISNNRADNVFLWAGNSIPALAPFYLYRSGKNIAFGGWRAQDNGTNGVLFPNNNGVGNIDGYSKWINIQGSNHTATVIVGTFPERVDIGKDLYVDNNVSAASFTDRTPAYMGDALKDIKMIANDSRGNIDHSTLPKFARRKIKIAKDGNVRQAESGVKADSAPITEQKYEEVEGRDIGAMVSMLTAAVQQLTEIVEKQQKQIDKLLKKDKGLIL